MVIECEDVWKKNCVEADGTWCVLQTKRSSVYKYHFFYCGCVKLHTFFSGASTNNSIVIGVRDSIWNNVNENDVVVEIKNYNAGIFRTMHEYVIIFGVL